MKTKNRAKRTFLSSLGTWKHIREIKINERGKHEVHFSEDFPFSVCFWKYSDDYRLTPNYHDYLEIAFVTEGTGKFLIENRTYAFSEGDVFVLSNNEFHSLQARAGGTFKHCALYFLPSLIYQPGGVLRDARLLWPFFNRSRTFENEVPLEWEGKKRLAQLLKSILGECAGRGREYELAVRNRLMEMLLVILRAYPPSYFSGREQVREDRETKNIEKVFQYVRENIRGDILLGRAAEIACMSESRFCRVFKKTTGHTLLDYVNRVRIDLARQLLLRSDTKVEQVASEVGFNTPSYFFKIFRRYANLSPDEYRRRAFKSGSL